VGLILDLAVAVLALIVITSLALLAWTLGVSAVRATRNGRRQVAELRGAVAEAEARLRTTAADADATIAALAARMTPPRPGDGPHA
jgi:hypothetical protein